MWRAYSECSLYDIAIENDNFAVQTDPVTVNLAVQTDPVTINCAVWTDPMTVC